MLFFPFSKKSQSMKDIIMLHRCELSCPMECNYLTLSMFIMMNDCIIECFFVNCCMLNEFHEVVQLTNSLINMFASAC